MSPKSMLFSCRVQFVGLFSEIIVAQRLISWWWLWSWITTNRN